jgi:hypothetical protein
MVLKGRAVPIFYSSTDPFNGPDAGQDRPKWDGRVAGYAPEIIPFWFGITREDRMIRFTTRVVRSTFGVASMDASLQFLTEEFTVAGMTFQYWMPLVAAILLIWISLGLASGV